MDVLRFVKPFTGVWCVESTEDLKIRLSVCVCVCVCVGSLNIYQVTFCNECYFILIRIHKNFERNQAGTCGTNVMFSIV